MEVVDAVELCQLTRFQRRSSNLSNLCLCQFSLRMRFATDPRAVTDGVVVIFLARSPDEVRGTVVRRIAIEMSNLGIRKRPWAVEGGADRGVDLHRHLLSTT